MQRLVAGLNPNAPGSLVEGLPFAEGGPAECTVVSAVALLQVSATAIIDTVAAQARVSL